MANANDPQGAKPYGEVKRLTPYVAGGTVYPGDLCKLNNAGKVVVAAAGDALLGAVISYGVSGDTILVADAVDQRFIITAASSAITSQTNMGNVADILATAGSSTYKLSRMALDDATLTATVARPLVLLGLEASTNNAFGANAKVIVQINQHQLKDSFAGV